MRPDYATPEDFAKWEEHAKTLDAYALRFTVEDCQQASRNMKGFNPVREGFYQDQACTYGMELTRRNRLSCIVYTVQRKQLEKDRNPNDRRHQSKPELVIR